MIHKDSRGGRFIPDRPTTRSRLGSNLIERRLDRAFRRLMDVEHGGSASQERFSTIPAVAIFPHPCAHSSISSKRCVNRPQVCDISHMKSTAAAVIALIAYLTPCASRADILNLATLSCGKYENEVLPAAATSATADSINTVMWLFGYSVAKSGAHVMYPDALAPFGFALDGECKTNPVETLLDALAVVKPETKNPMNLTTVECATFAPRHVAMAQSDPQSANTIMMWLFGFSTARSGSHLFNADLLGSFQEALLDHCAKHPDSSLFDTLSNIKLGAKPVQHPPKP